MEAAAGEHLLRAVLLKRGLAGGSDEGCSQDHRRQGAHLGEELGDAESVAERRANTTGHRNSHDCGGTTQPWRRGGEADRYGRGVRVELWRDLPGGGLTRRRRRASEADGETREG